MQPFFFLRPTINSITHAYAAPVATHLSTVSTVSISSATLLFNALALYMFWRQPQFMSNQYSFALNQYRWIQFAIAGSFLVFAVAAIDGVLDLLSISYLVGLWVAFQTLNFFWEMYLAFRGSFLGAGKTLREAALDADEWFILFVTRLPLFHILITLLWQFSLIMQQDKFYPLFQFFAIWGFIGFQLAQELNHLFYVLQYGRWSSYINYNFLAQTLFTGQCLWCLVAFVAGTSILPTSG